ncbi:unnamed protein product [Symbiodinium microadriaticum]|nr:unnamed protein product [Symbiodinium microadriaticum]
MKSRLGRRHPLIYGAALPIALLYYAVWSPPTGLEQADLFLWLLVVIVSLRLSLTFFDVPSSALAAELTDDYDGRTRLINGRVSTGWFTGMIMVTLMYGIWLAPTEAYPDGVTNPQGYRDAGLVGAVLIGFAILLSGIGLHGFTPWLARIGGQEADKRSSPLKDFPKRLIAILRNPSLRIVLISGVISTSAGATGTALWAYIYSYFWFVSTEVITTISIIQIGSTIAAFFLLPVIARGREKKSLVIILSVSSVMITAAPVAIAASLGFVGQGGPMVEIMLMVLGGIEVLLIVMSGSMIGSMTTDIVEEVRFDDQTRQEGMIMAAQSLTAKLAAASGVVIAGSILTWASFPEASMPGMVDEDALIKLGLGYAIVMAGLYAINMDMASRPHHIPQRKTASRASILEAAGAMLARNPGASLSEIALAAGVGRATLHRWFKGKDDLIRALALEALDKADAALDEIQAQDQPATDAVAAGFAALIPMGDRFHFLSQTEDLMQDEEIAQRYRAELRIVQNGILALIDQGAAAADTHIGWAIVLADSLIYIAWREVHDGRLTEDDAVRLATESFFKAIR